MYELTEVYKYRVGDSTTTQKTRPVLVNPIRVAFVRDYDTFRRVYFGNSADSDYVDVDESMEHIGAWVK